MLQINGVEKTGHSGTTRILYFLNSPAVLTFQFNNLEENECWCFQSNEDIVQVCSYSYLISLVWVVEQLPQGTGYERKLVSHLR